MEPRSTGTGITARKLLDARREIGCFLDLGLFSDPAYDILMSLLASEEECRTIELSECVRASNVSATTALRWIKLLEIRGLLSRQATASDGDAVTLKLTADTRTALRLP